MIVGLRRSRAALAARPVPASAAGVGRVTCEVAPIADEGRAGRELGAVSSWAWGMRLVAWVGPGPPRPDEADDGPVRHHLREAGVGFLQGFGAVVGIAGEDRFVQHDAGDAGNEPGVRFSEFGEVYSFDPIPADGDFGGAEEIHRQPHRRPLPDRSDQTMKMHAASR